MPHQPHQAQAFSYGAEIVIQKILRHRLLRKGFRMSRHANLNNALRPRDSEDVSIHAMYAQLGVNLREHNPCTREHGGELGQGFL